MDLETDIVRDVFRYYGLLGTMPCYHDNITDNACNHGNNSLNRHTMEFKNLKVIFSTCVMFSFIFEGLSSLVLEMVGIESVIGGGVIIIPILIILFPDECNKIWENFVYLINPCYKDYPNITIYEGGDYTIQHDVSILNLNDKSIEDYLKFVFIEIISKNSNRNPRNIPSKNNAYTNIDVNPSVWLKPKHIVLNGGDPDSKSTDNGWFEVGKRVKELYDEYNVVKAEGKTLEFAKAHYLELIALFLKFETIDVVEFLLNFCLFELSNENS
ncbi:hypothetical protein MBORA_17860 [Methanobrevibacter oralis]|uniref:Uncharacterized protein n=1 Tax=Methanobrevibacter oralis TaxID=66851 RepID=A0A165ZH41_METOA|nr:hypothetical protein [Methanobrevibacter oralis]KZX10706.1 hypothetical protein MBORA_17860 [Methanobrevibacter oralis]